MTFTQRLGKSVSKDVSQGVFTVSIFVDAVKNIIS